jgi:hypothetical protein
VSATERDTTDDWQIQAPIPTMAQLEERVDEAIAIARASEAAAISIGDIAIESAEQARRAADLAAKASAAASEGARRAGVADAASGGPASPAGPLDPTAEDEHLVRFMWRADRVSTRLATLLGD